jgi:Gpi18-like mannosyltransferase
MFLFVILGLYFAEKKKNILASLFLGLSLMFKYTSVLFLPYFVFRKKIIIVTLTLVFIGLYCFLPAIHLGLGQEMQYLKKWLPFISETSLDKGSWFDSKNQSLYSFILRLFAKDSAFKPIAQLTFFQGVAVATAIGLIMYLLIILPGRKNKNNTFIDYSLILICMALFNPNAWLANFVFFVFAYMVIAHHLIKVRYKDKVTLVLMILSFIVSSWVSESMVGDKLQNLFEALSTVTIAALILVGILLRLKFKKEITKSQDTIILKDRPR